VIDPDYHGNIQVLLYNFSDQAFPIEPGDEIAQSPIICNATPPTLIASTLPKTDQVEASFSNTKCSDWTNWQQSIDINNWINIKSKRGLLTQSHDWTMPTYSLSSPPML